MPAMQPANLSPQLRPFIAVLVSGGLLALLVWLRPSFGGVEFLLGFVLLAALVSVLPICLLILFGRPPQPGTSSAREKLWICLVATVSLPMIVGLFSAFRYGIDHAGILVVVVALSVILLVAGKHDNLERV